MTLFHLAQADIGRFRAPIDSPVLEGFRTQLDPINALADRSPGFVWRLTGEGNDATSLRPFDDDFIIVNMSVWATLEDLRDQVEVVSADVGEGKAGVAQLRHGQDVAEERAREADAAGSDKAILTDIFGRTPVGFRGQRKRGFQ